MASRLLLRRAALQRRWGSSENAGGAPKLSYEQLEARVAELESRIGEMQPLSVWCQEKSSTEFARLHGEWDYFVRRQQSLVNLKSMVPSGTPTGADVVNFAKYVYHEVPIRLVRRGKDLDRLPYGLSHMDSIRAVHGWYFQSFVALREMSCPESIDDCVKMLVQLRQVPCSFPAPPPLFLSYAFVETPPPTHPPVHQILERHGRTLEYVAKGIYDLKLALSPTSDHSPHLFSAELDDSSKRWWLESFPRLQQFLDVFNESRIGTRLLLAHLMELILQVGSREGWLSEQALGDGFRYSAFGHDPDTFVGLVNREMDAVLVAQHSALQVKKEAVAFYGSSPDIVVEAAGDIAPVRFAPHYLNTMVTELLKNSVRAVEEYKELQEKPKIVVTVCVPKGGTMTVRVSDNGGGIKRSNIELVQSYLYTTAEPAYADPCMLDHPKPWETGGSVFPDAPPLSSVPCSASPFAGYGYGLPITKSIANYFGGDFELVSQEGYGTCAYVYLNPEDAFTKRLT